jgi:VWFA-related protein
MTTSMDALAAERRRRVVLIFSDGMDSSGLLSSTTTFDDVRRRVQAEDVMVYTVGLAVVCDSKPAARLDGTGSPVLSFAAPATAQGRSSPPPPPGRIRIPPRPPLPRPPDPGRIPGRPPVDPFGRPAKTSDDEARCRESKPDPGLKELAGLGGGGYFELSGPNDLARTFARVADELHRQYLLAFPAPAADGQIHTIDVRLRQPNLTVRARKSYLAPAAR